MNPSSVDEDPPEFPPLTGILRASRLQLLIAAILLLAAVVRPGTVMLSAFVLAVGLLGISIRATGKLRLFGVLLNGMLVVLGVGGLALIATEFESLSGPLTTVFGVAICGALIGTSGYNAVAILRAKP
ncbi:MAG: hypothetical protein WD066_08160 [Planctomycetaceae bacterium]